jgi:hypothetical protein
MAGLVVKIPSRPADEPAGLRLNAPAQPRQDRRRLPA